MSVVWVIVASEAPWTRSSLLCDVSSAMFAMLHETSLYGLYVCWVFSWPSAASALPTESAFATMHVLCCLGFGLWLCWPWNHCILHLKKRQLFSLYCLIPLTLELWFVACLTFFIYSLCMHFTLLAMNSRRQLSVFLFPICKMGTCHPGGHETLNLNACF